MSGLPKPKKTTSKSRGAPRPSHTYETADVYDAHVYKPGDQAQYGGSVVSRVEKGRDIMDIGGRFSSSEKAEAYRDELKRETRGK